MRFYVIFNAKSGTALAQGLTEGSLVKSFEEQGLEAEIDARDDDLDHKIDRALRSDAGTIVCAGGDGTATAVARRLVGSDKALAVIPLGTANMLARDLKIPLSIADSIASLKDMTETEIDAGEVNGKVFLHKVVVGIVPAIAAAREKVRGRSFWALFGFARYMIGRLRNARKTAISIVSSDTRNRIERIHAIAVSNNAYDQGWGKLFSRSCLTAGCLTLYVLRRLTLSDAVRLALEMVAGRWQEDDAVTIETVRSITLGAKRRRVAAMIDGEVEILETPLEFRIRPKALRVLVPRLSLSEGAAHKELADADRSPVGPPLRAS